MLKKLHLIFNISRIIKLSPNILKILFYLMISTLFLGLYYIFLNSPEDYQQGDMVRIMYIHVPLASFSLLFYAPILLCAISTLLFRTKLAFFCCISIIPLGCCYSFLTLVTGSLWGKPIWGTYWAWDARLTSMLILFLFYLFKTMIIYSEDNLLKIEKPICILCIIGALNVPIVKFSVNLWSSLHQKSSIMRSGGISIDKSMLIPLFIMFLFFLFFSISVVLMNVNHGLLLSKNKNIRF